LTYFKHIQREVITTHISVVKILQFSEGVMAMTYVIDAKTPKGQAGQMLRAVNREAKANGAPETAVLEKRLIVTSSCKRINTYMVIWEDGPFEWAIIGEDGNIWGEEMGYTLYDRRLEPTFAIAPHVILEHNSRFDFTFCPDW
jgi:hypothetical protein